MQEITLVIDKVTVSNTNLKREIHIIIENILKEEKIKLKLKITSSICLVLFGAWVGKLCKSPKEEQFSPSPLKLPQQVE